MIKEIQWKLREKLLSEEIWSSYESLMKRDHWKKTFTVTFWRLLKFLKLKENSTTTLRLLKFLILKKGLRCFLTTLKVFNTEKRHHHRLKVFNTKKGLHPFLRTLKVSNIEKGLHHFLEALKGFNFEKWLRHILITRKVYQNSYSVECWWTAASEGRLSYRIYDQRTSPALSAQFHSNRNIFSFWDEIFLEWGDWYLF